MNQVIITERLVEQINEFSKLEKGWDSHKASPPSSIAIETAIYIVRNFTIKPIRVAPSVVGGIGMTFLPDREIYIEIQNNGEIYSVVRIISEDPNIEHETNLFALDRKIAMYSSRNKDGFKGGHRSTDNSKRKIK
jgi:hypothetical protein